MQVYSDIARPVGVEEEQPAPEKPLGFWQRNSLRLAGFLNLVGDVGVIGSGLNEENKFKVPGAAKERNWFKLTGGSLYTLGALNLARYGSVNREHNFRDTSERLAAFIQERTGALPEDSSLLNTLQNKRTDWQSQIDRALYKNPVKNTMGLYTIGAASMLGSGVKMYRESGKWSGAAYGATSLALKIGAFLIPEKQKDAANHKDEKKGVIGWITEKPLRFFGYGSFVTDSLMGWEAYQRYKLNPKKNSFMYAGISSASWLLADVMMAMSYKDPTNAGGAFTSKEVNRLVAMAAEVIRTQPKDKQHVLTLQVADFLNDQPHMRVSIDKINAALTKEIRNPTKIPALAAAPKDFENWASRVKSNTESAMVRS